MRRLAWNGVAVDVPETWELAWYRHHRDGRVALGIEDDTALRMELEWLSPTSETQARRFLARATRALERTLAQADRRTDIAGLPPDWRATRCEFREVVPTRRTDRSLGVVRHDLVTAAFTPASQPLRGVMRLHFLPGDSEDPEDLTRRIAGSFTVSDGGRVLWQIFDVSHELDAGFALETTAFDIGAKLLVFRRNGRRLHLWTLSCADRIFTGDTNETEWVARFLNAQRRIPGIAFQPGPNGTLAWRRRGVWALCHRDELARRCFRYAIGHRRDHARNQVCIWVYNHRHAADLADLADVMAMP